MSSVPKDAKSIFLAAIEKQDAAERNHFLDEACAGDAELRHRVEELISSFAKASEFMEDKPGAAFSTTERVAERAGLSIGRYKLLQEIGQGGFGVVFMAEQTEPVRRKVAVKVIKPGTRAWMAHGGFRSPIQQPTRGSCGSVAHDSGKSCCRRVACFLRMVVR